MNNVMNKLTISPIPAFSDNYIWLIQSGGNAYVVDPARPSPFSTLEHHGLALEGIWSRITIMTIPVQLTHSSKRLGWCIRSA